MTSNSSYNNDKVVTGEVEYPATDPASGAFFQTDYKKNEDLKLMLDGSKDSLKLEAMKRIIGMIAKGRDASDLFIDPNQLIRAGALRVLSSIRVPMIVPIVMLAIRDSAADMSPYTLFEPFLKSFFVRNSDPTHLKLLKLEILTNLATESSAAVVLREFQTYKFNSLLKMTSNSSYNNDKVVTGEVEYPATDPASGAFFQTDYKKNEDLKLMLDGSKDSLKLEAMKRIIGMIAKGRDASDLLNIFTLSIKQYLKSIYKKFGKITKINPFNSTHDSNRNFTLKKDQKVNFLEVISLKSRIIKEEKKLIEILKTNPRTDIDEYENATAVACSGQYPTRGDSLQPRPPPPLPRALPPSGVGLRKPTFPGCYLLNRMSTSSVKSARSERQAGSEAEAAPHEPQALSSSVSAALSMHCASSDVHAAFSSMVAATIKHTTLKP
ncbi:hypothetical protein MSG28_012117 [Choristoneura fumiferana]|uniref:Uncharacterized protein n=1 Tax=Choristoneura fumiferana TaxID=7141 RepID=A0ACC0KBW6_CHOFU|nr:hypothetical protein MSG28_012117 [Choristoneura fumiferana]